MTNQQGAPEALHSITRYEVVDCIESKHVPAVIPNSAGPWVRYEDHVAALVEAQQPAQAADSVLEDVARLDWLALAGPTSICVVSDRPHDGEVEVSTDDVTGYGNTLRAAIDAARAAQDGKK